MKITQTQLIFNIILPILCGWLRYSLLTGVANTIPFMCGNKRSNIGKIAIRVNKHLPICRWLLLKFVKN